MDSNGSIITNVFGITWTINNTVGNPNDIQISGSGSDIQVHRAYGSARDRYQLSLSVSISGPIVIGGGAQFCIYAGVILQPGSGGCTKDPFYIGRFGAHGL